MSKRGLNGTGTVGTAGTPSGTYQAIVLLVVHMAFNPHLDTNMAKVANCVKDLIILRVVRDNISNLAGDISLGIGINLVFRPRNQNQLKKNKIHWQGNMSF